MGVGAGVVTPEEGVRAAAAANAALAEVGCDRLRVVTERYGVDIDDYTIGCHARWAEVTRSETTAVAKALAIGHSAVGHDARFMVVCGEPQIECVTCWGTS